MPFFASLAENREPGIESLHAFVSAVQDFIGAILDLSIFDAEDRDTEMPYLFRQFHGDAQEVYRQYLPRSFDALQSNIPKIRPEHIEAHGLTGAPQRLKLRVLGAVEQARKRFQSVWDWLKEALRQINHILESIIDAVAASTGTPHAGLIKEFKDTLMITFVQMRS